jgi:hypothetical protein
MFSIIPVPKEENQQLLKGSLSDKILRDKLTGLLNQK